MSGRSRFKEEIHRRNARLTYDYPDDFVLHQWQSSSHVDELYLFYRFLFLAAFLSIGYVAVMWNLHPEDRAKVTIYFTNWSYLVCMVYGLVALVAVSQAYVSQFKGDPFEIPDFPCLYKAHWVLQNSATELSFGVSIIYWSLVHVTENVPVKRFTWSIHVWNSSLLLMDFFITSVPVRIMHVYFSLILGAIYAVFTFIYHCAGGIRPDGKHYIYKMLNWREHPLRAFMSCLLGLVFVIALRIFLFALFRLRIWILYKYHDEQDLTSSVRRRFVL